MSEQQNPAPGDPQSSGAVPLTPLLAEDPPKVGDFWLDARLVVAPSGIAFAGHDEANTPVMLILLSEGASNDAAARDRLAGVVNQLHIDTVVARGGHEEVGVQAGVRWSAARERRHHGEAAGARLAACCSARFCPICSGQWA